MAKHLVETNYEVASLLSSRKDKFNTGKVEGNAERKRKLIRMQKIRQLESSENMPVLTVRSLAAAAWAEGLFHMTLTEKGKHNLNSSEYNEIWHTCWTCCEIYPLPISG